MKKEKTRQVHQAQVVENYRELLEMVESKYAENVAYKYKKDITAKEPEYIEKTYRQFAKDIKALSTGLLNLGLENKRVVVIGNNRYEWCTTYMAVTTGNMVIVPLDKALPEGEMKNLIQRSEAEAVVFDSKYKETMLELKKDNSNNVKILISMDDDKDEGIEKYIEILKKGYVY